MFVTGRSHFLLSERSLPFNNVMIILTRIVELASGVSHFPFTCLIFHAFLSSADFFFSKSTFSKNSFRNSIRVSNSLDPDQARCFVEPDLGSNCLQRSSADDTSWQIVNLALSSVIPHCRHKTSIIILLLFDYRQCTIQNHAAH